MDSALQKRCLEKVWSEEHGGHGSGRAGRARGRGGGEDPAADEEPEDGRDQGQDGEVKVSRSSRDEAVLSLGIE